MDSKYNTYKVIGIEVKHFVRQTTQIMFSSGACTNHTKVTDSSEYIMTDNRIPIDLTDELAQEFNKAEKIGEFGFVGHVLGLIVSVNYELNDEYAHIMFDCDDGAYIDVAARLLVITGQETTPMKYSVRVLSDNQKNLMNLTNSLRVQPF